MIGKPIRMLFALLMGCAVLFASACGTVATPEWAADAQATQVAILATSDAQTAAAPTATYTSTPQPTATPIPPTATNTPEPTATPIPTETAAPTEEVTEEVTEEATADSTADLGQSTVSDQNGGSDEEFAAAVAEGDPVAGQAAFQLARTMPDGQVWSCAQCHSVTPDELRIIGPGLWNVAVRGETREEYDSALQYIHHSIIYPNEYIVPPDANGAPYPPNLMPQHYNNPAVLPPQELIDITAYLLTLQD